MRRSAAPIFESARKDAAEADRAPRAADSAMPPQQLAELIESLREQSLSALYRFDAIAPHLKPLLGSASFEVVREHMENLRFMEAAKALEANGVAGSGSLDEAVPTLENDAAHGSC
jgi:hypothetical protein